MSMVGTFAIKAISTFKLMMKSTCLSLLQESTMYITGGGTQNIQCHPPVD